MEKREKTDDFEFEGAVDSTQENAELPEPEKEENAVREDDNRLSELEQLFGAYPETLTLLTGEQDFPIDGKITHFMASVEGFARGGGLSHQEIDTSLKMLFNIAVSVRNGVPTLDMIEVLMKGISYDQRLEEEVRAAELRGRNANIEARMRTKTAGDGVPHLESRSGGNEKRNRGIFSLAEDARR